MIKGRIDLGTALFDMKTARTHNHTFLGSTYLALKREKCASAADLDPKSLAYMTSIYHDADFWFMMSMQNAGTYKHVKQLLFGHN